VIRVVLAVVFAAALLSAGLEAAEHGTRRHDETLADDRLESLASTVERFAATNDPVPPGHEGATIVARIRVPESVVVALGVATEQPARGRVAWYPEGDSRDYHQRWVDVPLRTPDGRGPLVLRAGRHRLRLSLVRVDGRAVVDVRRFRNENGTSLPHAGIRIDGRGRRLPV
jgi:hypothetical protein